MGVTKGISERTCTHLAGLAGALYMVRAKDYQKLRRFYNRSMSSTLQVLEILDPEVSDFNIRPMENVQFSRQYSIPDHNM